MEPVTHWLTYGSGPMVCHSRYCEIALAPGTSGGAFMTTRQAAEAVASGTVVECAHCVTAEIASVLA